MTTRILLLAIVTGFALQACSSAPGGSDQASAAAAAASTKCKDKDNKNDCDITVIVVELSDGTCLVSVAQALETIEFTETTKAKKVSWTIDESTGYTFPLNGIVFTNDDQAEFVKPKLSNRDRTYEYTNKHSFARIDPPYKYKITVVKGSGSHLCKLDPKIVNR